MVYNWQKLKMKKKILMAIAVIAVMTAGIVSLSAFTTSNNANPEPNSCRLVSNVNVSLSRNGENYTVTAINYNKYAVTVAWTAVGYRDGAERRVGGSTISVPAYNPSSHSGYDHCTRTTSFSTSCEDVALGRVDVYTCD